jgi:hypothetical protein
MRELAKIKREREEERKKQESQAAEELAEQEKEAALTGYWGEGGREEGVGQGEGGVIVHSWA